MTKGRPHLCLVPPSEPPRLFREPEWDASSFPAWVLPGRARDEHKAPGSAAARGSGLEEGPPGQHGPRHEKDTPSRPRHCRPACRPTRGPRELTNPARHQLLNTNLPDFLRVPRVRKLPPQRLSKRAEDACASTAASSTCPGAARELQFPSCPTIPPGGGT